ncbi:hypothetical protein U1Q18_021500 [Sarracenia purpurea var. burkii]
MKSSNSRDMSFKARVQKNFGSLSLSHSPWSLTDNEDRRNSRYVGRDVKIDLDDLNDDGYEKDEELGIGPKRGDSDGDDRDEREIISGIGMDCTLDNEGIGFPISICIKSFPLASFSGSISFLKVRGSLCPVRCACAVKINLSKA